MTINQILVVVGILSVAFLYIILAGNSIPKKYSQEEVTIREGKAIQGTTRNVANFLKTIVVITVVVIYLIILMIVIATISIVNPHLLGRDPEAEEV